MGRLCMALKVKMEKGQVHMCNYTRRRNAKVYLLGQFE